MYIAQTTRITSPQHKQVTNTLIQTYQPQSSKQGTHKDHRMVMMCNTM